MRLKYFSFFYLALVACTNNTSAVKEPSILVKQHTIAVNNAIDSLIAAYYVVKDNFIAEDDTAITKSTKKLIVAIATTELAIANDSILQKLPNSTQLTSSLLAEAKGLLLEETINSKRKSLQMISNLLFDYLQLMQYKNKQVYQQYCPMAFNNNGAEWLSNTTDIKNPYLPISMLNCGEVTDTLVK